MSSSIGSGTYRTLPAFADWSRGNLDFSNVDQYAKLLEQTKSRAAQEDIDRALTTITRYAAVDTGAIEGLYQVDRGFTKTIATQAGAWESALSAKGEPVKRAIDDALAAYELVLDATTGKAPVSETFIRHLHEVVCRSQDTYTVHTAHGPSKRPLPRGAYKTMPNSPTTTSGVVHAYAPPIDTAPEMARLISELRSPEFAAAHPVVQAAYAHYGFVCIHPFADGNGRVSRALASLYLYRSPGVPLVVFADQRDKYFDALEAADAGNFEPSIAFIRDQTIDAISMVRASFSGEMDLEDRVAQLIQQVKAKGVNPEQEAAVGRARDLLKTKVDRQITDLKLPGDLEMQTLILKLVDLPVPEHYVELPGSSISLIIESPVGNKTVVRHQLTVVTRTHSSALSEFLVLSTTGGQLDIHQRDLVPQATQTLRFKLTNWVEARLIDLVSEFSEKIRTDGL